MFATRVCACAYVRHAAAAAALSVAERATCAMRSDATRPCLLICRHARAGLLIHCGHTSRLFAPAVAAIFAPFHATTTNDVLRDISEFTARYRRRERRAAAEYSAMVRGRGAEMLRRRRVRSSEMRGDKAVRGRQGRQ